MIELLYKIFSIFLLIYILIIGSVAVSPLKIPSVFKFFLSFLAGISLYSLFGFQNSFIAAIILAITFVLFDFLTKNNVNYYDLLKEIAKKIGTIKEDENLFFKKLKIIINNKEFEIKEPKTFVKVLPIIIFLPLIVASLPFLSKTFSDIKKPSFLVYKTINFLPEDIKKYIFCYGNFTKLQNYLNVLLNDKDFIRLICIEREKFEEEKYGYKVLIENGTIKIIKDDYICLVQKIC